MAGHSKWANIRHRKGRQDVKRGKVFTKLIRELTIAAKGSPSPEDNPRLRLAIDKALSANMTRDTIDRAIARGSGTADTGHMDEITYEGYANGGVAILVAAVSDNRNRTVAEIRHAFSKNGGNLGTDGSVAYLFERRGMLMFAASVDEDQLIQIALESGADDVINEEECFVVYTQPDSLLTVLQACQAANIQPQNHEIAMVAQTTVALDDAASESLAQLIDALEDLDDVQNVYSNAQ